MTVSEMRNSRSDGVVPLAVEFVWADGDVGHVRVGNADAAWVSAIVTFRVDFEAGLGCGGANQIEPRRWLFWRHLIRVPEGLYLFELFLCQLARYFAALDLFGVNVMLDDLDDLWIRKRGDIARARKVGDACYDAAHDLARSSLRHIGDDPDVLRPSDLPYQVLDRS
jgi:hypothetical protein